MKKLLKYKTLDSFTLAEILITLGIIGIIAAITIPMIINKSQEKISASGLKKAYTQLNQVYMQILKENGDSFVNVANNSDDLRDKFAPYYKAIKSCDDGTTGCFTYSDVKFKWLNGVPTNFSSDSSFVSADGQAFNFYLSKADCTGTRGTLSQKFCGEAYIDINGKKNPNQFGKDIFVFYILSNKIAPAGSPGDIVDCTTEGTGYGVGCAFKYLYEE